ncbi:hypothetical protein KI387_040465, partial [Taxus chinensis]
AREVLHMRDAIPELLETILPDVTDAEWCHLELARLGGFHYYRWVPRDVELMRALMQRWDSQTCTFWFQMGEMTITHEDIYRILRLPITGDLIEITPWEQQRRALVRLYGDKADASEIVSGAVRIASQYRKDDPRSRLIALIQMAISYYALPDSRGGWFPLLLLDCVCDILEFMQVFTFTDALLAQIYHELWMYSTGRRTGIDVSFVLHCWAYEHISVIRPSGIPWMSGAEGALDYGFR